jgi:hypothetical protein
MADQISSAARRVVRSVISDGRHSLDSMSDAVDDLLSVGMEPMLVLRTLESLDDIAEQASTRKRAAAAAASIREQMRDAIRGEGKNRGGGL